MNAEDYKIKVRKTENLIHDCNEKIKNLENQIGEVADAETTLRKAQGEFHNYINSVKGTNARLRAASFSRFIGGIADSAFGLLNGAKYLAMKLEFEKAVDATKRKRTELEQMLQEGRNKLKELKKNKEMYQRKYEEKLREERSVGGGGRSF